MCNDKPATVEMDAPGYERLGAIVYLAGSIIFDEANSAEAAPGLGEIEIMEGR
jgi:hypothetical protein